MADPACLHEACLDAAADVVRALDLDGIGDTRVYVQELGGDRVVEPPAALLAPEVDGLPVAAWDTANNAPAYQVRLFLVDVKGELPWQKPARLLRWLARCEGAFANRRLAGVPEVFNLEWAPQCVIDPTAFRQSNVLLATALLTFRCVVPRT